MGSPNMDFFVREVRECINGDMVVIRLGSCGALVDVPVGSVAVPNASLAITRNVDFDFANPGGNSEPAYKFSKQVPADLLLHSKLQAALEAARPSTWQGKIIAEAVNASADSFYSSQGRQTSFPDHNTELIHQLQSSVPNAATLEMETFHLFHLAACWSNVPVTHSATPPPLSAAPVKPTTISEPQAATAPATSVTAAANSSVIRAAAVQMIFANRTSRDFITPEQVAELEHWTGKVRSFALTSPSPTLPPRCVFVIRHVACFSSATPSPSRGLTKTGTGRGSENSNGLDTGDLPPTTSPTGCVRYPL
ncbi:hypothetical protein AX16_010009 [Volvariella volvacea WC 439]|nr:hypothetical protein AX16_010009 [Volvariella volvacea WC 439]